MARFDDAWTAHQRRHWLRPDWQRWMRPDAHRYFKPGAEGGACSLEPMPNAPDRFGAVRPQWDAAAQIEAKCIADALATERLRLRWLAADLRLHLALRACARKAGFKEDQPRWPKGSGDISGRWSGGAGTGGAASSSEGPTRGGHHFVSKEAFKHLPLRPETRRVFDRAVTGPLHARSHRWSKEHERYNDAVAEHFQRFVKEKGVRPEDMTPDQARELVDEVKRSRDPRIRNYNMRLYMREIIYWLRRMPRGTE